MAFPLPDRYVWLARVAPAVIVVLPLAFVLASIPSTRGSTSSLALGTLGGAALTVLAAQLSADAGRRRERDLFHRWGGAPTTRFLRHRNSPMPGPTLARYHRKLEALMGSSLPTEEEERVDTRAADERYSSAVQLLRERTRDRDTYPALFGALADYGFRRNAWGMRPVGLITSVLGLLVCGISAARQRDGDGSATPTILALASGGLFLIWWSVVTRAWVRRGADAYAERLLGALDLLSTERKAGRQ